jgi:hypothetical protein
MACQWCVEGAIIKIGADNTVLRTKALRHLGMYLGVDSVTKWNDTQTNTEAVVATLRAAAETADLWDYLGREWS